MKRRSAAAAFFVLCAHVAAASDRILLVDLTQETPVVVSTPASSTDVPKNIGDACEGHDGHSPAEIQSVMMCLRPSSSLRWISKRGDTLSVYVLYTGTRPTIRFAEPSRKSRIATDLEALMKLAARVAFAPEAGGGAPLSCTSATHMLERQRANLAVDTQQNARPAGVVLEGGGAPAPNSTPAAKATLVTGPAEHFFLAADLPFRRFKDVKLDDSTHTFQPVTKPTRLFVSVAYALGDLLSDEGKESWMDGVVVKSLFLAAKTPLESFGVALGYRGTKFSSVGFSFDTVSPFVAYMWTRSEAAGPDATAKLTSTVQAGFSFNLDAALGWTKGGDR